MLNIVISKKDKLLKDINLFLDIKGVRIEATYMLQDRVGLYCVLQYIRG